MANYWLAFAALLLYFASCLAVLAEKHRPVGTYRGAELMSEILANSSKHLRPVNDASHSTEVEFRLSLYQILGWLQCFLRNTKSDFETVY